MSAHHPTPPEEDLGDSAELPPPVYEVEEEPVERRINPEGKFIHVVDGKEIVIERRNRDDA